MVLSKKTLVFGLIGIVIAPTFYLAGNYLTPVRVSAGMSRLPIINRFIPSPTPTPTLIPTNTPTPIPTLTPTPTDTPTPKPTLIPTPTQTPTPTSVPVTSNQLDGWFTQYSNHYSIDRQKLWNIAVCESGLRPNATNGIYGGLYQFSASAWHSTRSNMNENPDPDLRFNPEEAIKTAAFKISVSGYNAWPNCGKK
jgi:hypothetical protein